MSHADWIGRRAGAVAGLLECSGLQGAGSPVARNYVLRRQGPLTVRLRGVPHPVVLRGRTSDVQTFLQIFALQEYGFDHFAQATAVQDAYDSALAEGRQPLVIDCGANVGLSAVWLALRFPKARIVAIEPSRENMRILEENTRHYPQIAPRCAAVSDTRTRARVVNPGAEAWAYRTAEVTGDAALGVPRCQR